MFPDRASTTNQKEKLMGKQSNLKKQRKGFGNLTKQKQKGNDPTFEKYLALTQSPEPKDPYQKMLRELKGLELRQQMVKEDGEHLSDFDKARLILFFALSQCWDDRYKILDPEIETQIKQAGKMLYDFDGMKAMRNDLVWAFLPKSLGGEVEIIWDGIGDWVA